MVEVKLETAGFDSYASDHYISMRVGEAQKLGKLSTSRSFKFPGSVVGNRKFGRVEIFKRVGTGTVCIDPEQAEQQNQVDIAFDGFTLRVNATVNATEEKKPKTKAQSAATEYFNKHNLEVRLSDAMQAVLRERPADPAAFIAEQLTQNADIAAKLPGPPPGEPPSAQVPESAAPQAVAGGIAQADKAEAVAGGIAQAVKEVECQQVKSRELQVKSRELQASKPVAPNTNDPEGLRRFGKALIMKKYGDPEPGMDQNAARELAKALIMKKYGDPEPGKGKDQHAARENDDADAVRVKCKALFMKKYSGEPSGPSGGAGKVKADWSLDEEY